VVQERQDVLLNEPPAGV